MTIDFEPSWMDADLVLLRSTIVRFIESEVLPDDEAARKRGNVGHALWRRAGELGLLCLDVPEEYGGGGGDYRHEAVFNHELARRSLTGMAISAHSLVARFLLDHANEDQRRRYLPRMASGELVGAIAVTEPDAGSDVQGIRTTARRVDGDYVLNGSKIFISNGLLAGIVLVVAKTDAGEGARGMSILILETEGLNGYRVGRVLDKIGQKAQDTAELFFDDVRVPACNLLGGVEGKGFGQLSGLCYERVTIGITAVAAMEGAYDATLSYVRGRHAFGRPIAEFQNTRFKLAEIATQIKVARTFIDRCVTELAAGHVDMITSSMAKWWLTELHGKVIDECLQLHGGYGYMNEYLISRLYLDARVRRIYGGTSEIMKEMIARSL
ncbi:MAG: acyl-CoA dehydrogenase [Bordetella sp. SCN 67-23]|uniref:acyl-CoA dehydrogenase family protein n=1 Tax=Hyphomicrobium sp. TaxID=82 RepID=UPI00086A5B97|nr:acyl-CoA dehydrogenase family protein [Hyphomicrobium sp.]MCC7254270.1 acyl-CoA dehydrogenase family protein [Hyphomicrobium sp.]ODS70818.1 MAG: acyl-CoA dehydrogenase [Bordetella sp. SCN 67-23]